MTVLDQIKKRRSIRKYTGESLTDEQITTLLEAAMAAPSASNLQPWEFVIVRDPQHRRKLAEMKTWSFMCADAGAVFAVIGDEQKSRHWVEDTSAATQNLLLQAASMDLGSVWIAVYPDAANEAYVRSLLEIPDRLRVLCLVAVGYPDETKPPHTKYDESKIHNEVF
jgi:nitroreductase